MRIFRLDSNFRACLSTSSFKLTWFSIVLVLIIKLNIFWTHSSTKKKQNYHANIIHIHIHWFFVIMFHFISIWLQTTLTKWNYNILTKKCNNFSSHHSSYSNAIFSIIQFYDFNHQTISTILNNISSIQSKWTNQFHGHKIPFQIFYTTPSIIFWFHYSTNETTKRSIIFATITSIIN